MNEDNPEYSNQADGMNQPSQSNDYQWAQFEPEVVSPSAGNSKSNGMPPLRFGLWFLAWPVVLLLTAFIMATPYLLEALESEEDSESHAAQLAAIEGVAKYQVGLKQMTDFDLGSDEETLEQLEQLNSGPYINRLGYVITVGELAGAKQALAGLRSIDEAARAAHYEPEEVEKELHQSLTTLYNDFEKSDWKASSLSESEKSQLEEQLGWLGELALTPADSPNELQREELLNSALMTLNLVIVLVLLVGGGALAGFFIACVFLVQVFQGKLVCQTANRTRNGMIYIETFAVWMVMFLGFSFAAGYGAQYIESEQGALLANAIAFIGSLSVLLYPLMRGVGWGELCEDIGWRSSNIFAEVMWGFICYLGTLPLVIGGFVTTSVLLTISSTLNPTGPFEEIESPSHPMQDWIAESGWSIGFLVLFLAAVCAPILEETMFRGVLYRHLRDISAKWRIGLSVAFSTIINSVIFAAIHPQGVFLIPVLASLAVGFSLTREWRGSVVSPMVMHAIHNSAVTLIALTAF